MTPDTIHRLDTMLAASPIIRAADTPSEAEVAEAEKQIGVPFPEDYRLFLLRYGGAMVGPHPIFGLRPVDVMGDDLWCVVDVTRHYRSQGISGTDQWVVISADHCGNPVGLDQTGAVWIHDHDFGGLAHLARDFEDYVRTWCLKLPNSD